LSKNKGKRREFGRRRKLLDFGGGSPLYGDYASFSPLYSMGLLQSGDSYDLVRRRVAGRETRGSTDRRLCWWKLEFLKISEQRPTASDFFDPMGFEKRCRESVSSKEGMNWNERPRGVTCFVERERRREGETTDWGGAAKASRTAWGVAPCRGGSTYRQVLVHGSRSWD